MNISTNIEQTLTTEITADIHSAIKEFNAGRLNDDQVESHYYLERNFVSGTYINGDQLEALTEILEQQDSLMSVYAVNRNTLVIFSDSVGNDEEKDFKSVAVIRHGRSDDTEKRNALIAKVDNGVTLENLERLTTGVLTKIGQALIDNIPVLNVGKRTKEIEDFSAPTHYYRIEDQDVKCNFNGHVYSKPCTEPLEIGTTYYLVDLAVLDYAETIEDEDDKSYIKVWQNTYLDNQNLKLGLVQRDADNAERQAAAMRSCLAGNNLMKEIR